MKYKITPIMLGIALICALQVINATVEPATILKPGLKENFVAKPRPLILRTIEDFLSLTPKKYTEMTGKKMTLPKKVYLKIAQHKVKRAIKKGKSVDLDALSKAVDTSDFNIGGFILGLFLSIIGVIIAYLIGDSNVTKWAWIGFAISVAIWIIVLII